MYFLFSLVPISGFWSSAPHLSHSEMSITEAFSTWNITSHHDKGKTMWNDALAFLNFILEVIHLFCSHCFH